MLRAWRPRHLVVADIGSGFWGEGPKDRDGLEVGDVVVASDIQYFEVEKQVKDGETRSRSYPIQLPSTGPRDAFRSMHLRQPNWYEPAEALRPMPSSGPPKLLDGQVVCGEKLLSDPNSELVARLVKRYEKALGLDMESAGIGRAVLALQREGIFTQFSVLRGVSDLFDKKDEDNQQVRDEWKPYAARVAISAAAAWIAADPSDKGVIATGGTLPQVLRTAKSLLIDLPDASLGRARPEKIVRYVEGLHRWLTGAAHISESAFRLKLQATSHRAFMSGAPEEAATVERGELLSLTLFDRKVVVVGPSGAGKSVLLRQILRQVAAQEEPLVVHVDLKENPKWAERLVKLPDERNIDDSIGALLTASALVPTACDLADFATDRLVVLIVDALNEVPADVGEKIRLALDQYVRFHQSVHVLVSDRRTEQFYRESRWTVLHLSGVTEDEARRVVDGDFWGGTFDSLSAADQRLLCVPFFLDRALRSKRVKFGSRVSAVGDFLVSAGIAVAEIDSLARCAFRVYERGESVLGEEEIKLLDRNSQDKLRDAEIVVEDANGPIFDHQLVHQYLAGCYLGQHPEEWTAETLDSVTAPAASLDAVGMTIAAITQQGERDRFLRIVFDWNWRAAVSALIETQTQDRQVSELLATAVLAMAAEKRFDGVQGTRERVEGLLREVPGPIAERMRNLESRDQLIAEILAIDSEKVLWWTAWREIFIRCDRELTLSERELAAIGSPEPLIGWTVANTLRRFGESESAATLLRMELCAETAGRRCWSWRPGRSHGLSWTTFRCRLGGAHRSRDDGFSLRELRRSVGSTSGCHNSGVGPGDSGSGEVSGSRADVGWRGWPP